MKLPLAGACNVIAHFPFLLFRCLICLFCIITHQHSNPLFLLSLLRGLFHPILHCGALLCQKLCGAGTRRIARTIIRINIVIRDIYVCTSGAMMLCYVDIQCRNRSSLPAVLSLLVGERPSGAIDNDASYIYVQVGVGHGRMPNWCYFATRKKWTVLTTSNLRKRKTLQYSTASRRESTALHFLDFKISTSAVLI